ncbi:MAG: C/D box methylation guide ribonucleoprotein complex aNOP56 subunit [Candidatus Odinarchaeota archaeon]|nr:C/D box methylation guide ribonucleoprotein complex aNOP56 subunit [Candidatus Odinarchaeota archaeon]
MKKIHLVETILGIMAVDDQGNVIEKELFEKNSEEVAEKIYKLQQGEIIPELQQIAQKVKNVEEIVVEDESLAKALREMYQAKITVEKPSPIAQQIRAQIPDLAQKYNYAKSLQEYIQLTHQIATYLTRRKIRTAAEKRDQLIAQAIETIDDIDKTLNLFASRIREWYGLHFPELNKLIDEHRTYIRLVKELGLRKNYTRENLQKTGFPPERVKELEESAKTSMGANIAEEDIEPLQKFASITLKLYQLRKELEEYIDESMKETAPNIRGLVGSLLGARLISLAGSLEELARMPASTIQVLGAEKALFRALRTGARPPKHGVLFQYPAIHGSPRWQRGKIARAVAGKLAIAARIDAFSGEYMADELKAELEKRIEEIKKKYPKPPKRKKPEKVKKIKIRKKKKEKRKKKGK